MAEGLEGIRVLELGGGVAAPLVGKLMGDLGAEVVKIEPPEGEPARRRGPFPNGRANAEANPETSGLFLALNANKRSLTLHLREDAGRAALDDLAARAHLLVHNHTPREMEALGLDYARFAGANPGLVMLSITPFGLTGPYRDYAAAELNLMHSSGWGFNCPAPGADPALPPIKPFGQHACIQAGLHGATAATAAIRGVLEGQPGEHIDLSVQEATLTCLGRHLVNYSYTGFVDSRLKARAYAPNGFFRCEDGIIYLVTIEEDQWRRLMELLGNPEWARAQGYETKWSRAGVEQELNGRLHDCFAQWKAEDLYRACQQRRICATRVYGYDALLEEPHIKARGGIQIQHHPVAGALPMPVAPYLLQRPWWKLRRPAPLLGEANGEMDALLRSGNGTRQPAPMPLSSGIAPLPAASDSAPPPLTPLPLKGIRVLDFTWVWAGPHCALMLANLGADVLKVESPNRPDLLRRTNIVPKDVEQSLNVSGTFNQIGQGKRSVAINLSDPGGLELVRRMAKQCDVVISNFSTGVMERFGLGAGDLHRINPELIVAAISGFGQTGPCKDYIGYGQAMVPLSGISSSTGYAGQGPAEVATAYGDPNAGIVTAYAVTAALTARKLHGGGQYIDVSLWEAMAAAGFEGWINHALGNQPYTQMGNRDPVWAPHNCYRCTGEDAWVSIAVTEEAHWAALRGAMGQPELAGDPRFRDAAARKAHEDQLDEIISVWCADKSPWQVTRLLQAADVPAFPSLTTQQVAEDPHLEARQYFGQAPHAEVGVRKHTGMPWRLHNRPSGVVGPAPLLGEHTGAVLKDVLNLDDSEIARLRGEGIVG